MTRIHACWCELFTGNQLIEYELALFAAICWFIWKDRCSLVFENTSLNPLNTIKKASLLVDEYWNANGWCRPILIEPSAPLVHHWELPNFDTIKANSDGPFVEGSYNAGVGVIFRNHAGELVESVSCVLPAPLAFMAEALALRKAFQMALDLEIQSCF